VSGVTEGDSGNQLMWLLKVAWYRQ